MSMWCWVVARVQHLRLQEARQYSTRSSGKNRGGTRQRLARLDSGPSARLDAAAQRLLASSGDKEAQKKQEQEQLLQKEGTRSIRPEPKLTPREAETERQAMRIIRDAHQPTVRTMASALATSEEQYPVQMRFQEMFASRGPASQHFMVGKDPEAIDRLGERLRSRGVLSPETRHVFERIHHHADDHLDPDTYTEHDISVATLQADMQRVNEAEPDEDPMRGERPDHYEISLEQARWVDQAHTGVEPDGRYEPDLPADEDADDDDDDDEETYETAAEHANYDGNELERYDQIDEPPEDETPFRTWDPRTRRYITKEEASHVGTVLESQINEEILDRVRETVSPDIVRGITVEEQASDDESDLSDTETTYKVCLFCSSDPPLMDPMNIHMIARYLDPIGRLMPRVDSGLCALHQRKLARTVKRAHHLKLLSFKRRTFVMNDPFAPPVSRLTPFGDDDELHPAVSEPFVDKQIEKTVADDQDSIDADTDNPFQVYLNDPKMQEPLNEEELSVIEEWKQQGIKFQIPDPIMGFNTPTRYTVPKNKKIASLRRSVGLDNDEDEDVEKDIEDFETDFGLHEEFDVASDDEADQGSHQAQQ